MKEKFVDTLIEKKITLATAESCTGGLISKMVTDVPGSSAVFFGGIVCYSNELKMKLLGVREETLITYGAVSKQTVAEMLEGITEITNSQCAIAISGIAGPGGGTVDKPIGTVFIGVKYHNHNRIERMQFDGDRTSVREQAAITALQMANQMISST